MIRLRNKKPLMIALIFIVVVFFFYNSIIFNLTPSMAEGFYLKSVKSLNKGDTVLICLNTKFSHLGLERHYLYKSKHVCQDMVPLIKQIIAIPGDDVILSETSITINGVTYPYTLFKVDGKGRPLSAYPSGYYLNTQGYWLMGKHDPKSWDSRYWGPIPAKQIKNHLIPLITW